MAFRLFSVLQRRYVFVADEGIVGVGPVDQVGLDGCALICRNGVEQGAKRAEIEDGGRILCVGSEQSESWFVRALVGVPGLAHQGCLAAGSECADVEGFLAAADGEFGDEVAERGDAACIVAAVEMVASEAEQDFGCGL